MDKINQTNALIRQYFDAKRVRNAAYGDFKVAKTMHSEVESIFKCASEFPLLAEEMGADLDRLVKKTKCVMDITLADHDLKEAAVFRLLDESKESIAELKTQMRVVEIVQFVAL